MKIVKNNFRIIIASLLFIYQGVLAQNYFENPIMKEYVEIAKIKDQELKYEKIINLIGRADSINKYFILNSAAKIAFETKHYEQSRDLSLELLELSKMYSMKIHDWNSGNAIHDGNMVLGRLAVVDNDIEKAKEYLLLAGKTSGSPQLNSFGPNVSLADDLLKLGESEIVIEYLSICRKFWELGKEKLDKWENDIKKGNIPEFGANLVY